VGLWTTLAAIAIAGTAVALTSGGSPVHGAGPGGTRISSGTNPGLNRLSLPDTFLGVPRNDDSDQARSAQQQVEAAQSPHEHGTSAVYQDGYENTIVQAFESDGPYSSQDRADVLAQLPSGDGLEEPGLTITHGEIKEMDPGPLGGVLRCAVVTVQTDTPDALGADGSVMTQCGWLDDNTYVTVTEASATGDPDLSAAAAHTRQLRAQAETRR
jgi:hypothetical protein